LDSQLNPISEVETTDDADDADKPELGVETGRMSPKHAPQPKPIEKSVKSVKSAVLISVFGLNNSIVNRCLFELRFRR
jgi:hypothetical protein